MWRSVPALVALRDAVDGLVRETVERGDAGDCVTHEHIVRLAQSRGQDAGHHVEQLRAAVRESPAWAELGAVPPQADVVVAEGDAAREMTGGLFCFGCGPITRLGYSRWGTLSGVRLRDGSQCEMNLGCECSE